MKNLIRFSLILIILFSFSTIVKAVDYDDYELLIITPKKFETVAQQFQTLHNNAGMNTCYAIVEEIVGAYDGKPSGGPPEPSPAEAPPVPATPGEDQIGGPYPPSLDPVPNLCIIKFLRGVLSFEPEVNEYIGGQWSDARARRLLHPVIYKYEAKFQYLLLLGETGAAGPRVSTYNGVPESWYVWMDDDVYDQDPDADGSIFPTDFFYASPNYYGAELNWIPNLRVGRIPVHDLSPVSDSGTVTQITAITDPLLITNPYNMDECDVCDSTKNWIVTKPAGWAGYELWIVSDGNPADDDEDAPIGATYRILDNNDTCLRVLGDPSAAGVEAEELGPPFIPGDGYEIHDTGLDEAQAIYNKCAAYMNAVTTPNAWNNWFRKVVTVGGDHSQWWWWWELFSFWDEFVLAQITNEGSFEGNEIIKLRHTNKDDVDLTNDFTVTSLAPYLNDQDCGLLFLLGGDTVAGDTFYIDWLSLDDGYITNADLLTYTSSDDRIPIMVSNTDGHGLFDYCDEDSGIAYPSFGEMVVESPTGGGIAYIGATSTTYSGIIPFFNKGVVYQERLYNMDELLSYTMKSFHLAPRYIGDMFMGSPAVPGGQPQGPIYDFLISNLDSDGNLSFWASQKTVWEYTLLGDPALPIPYPQSMPIETGTSAPGLAFNENTLRSKIPKYESHDIGVDEIPTGGSASTTINIRPVNSPSAVPQVKITRVDIRRDLGKHYYEPVSVPSTYTFATPNGEPGYYFVKVEQPGFDQTLTGDWGNWWEKERWIYIQEVNQFTPTNSILVVDDDFGYPIVTTNEVYGYEDWYLKALDGLPSSDYDVWHVDFDDNLFNVVWNSTGDDWNGIDAGDALMHGEVYQGLLNNYDKVIWLTGDPPGYWRPYPYPYPERTTWMIETLTTPEQTRLKEYLNQGGRLFLSGQGILDDLGCSGLTESDDQNICLQAATIDNEFLTNYLHITALYATAAYGYLEQVRSVPENPIIANYGINIAGGDGAHNQYIFDDVEPDTGVAKKVFEYDRAGGAPPGIGEDPFWGTAGICHYQGCGANVFLPWGFEAIDRQINRDQVMAAVLSWLNSPTLTGPYVGCSGNGDGDGGDGGAGGGVGSLSGCFIATACYGTPMAREVRVLSNFRDEYLMTNSLGSSFVGTYYKFSPQLAEYISERPLLKKFIRMGLKPFVWFSGALVEEQK